MLRQWYCEKTSINTKSLKNQTKSVWGLIQFHSCLKKTQFDSSNSMIYMVFNDTYFPGCSSLKATDTDFLLNPQNAWTDKWNNAWMLWMGRQTTNDRWGRHICALKLTQSHTVFGLDRMGRRSLPLAIKLSPLPSIGTRKINTLAVFIGVCVCLEF